MRATFWRRFIKRLVLTAGLILAIAQDSHAYLDLGTGSYLLQIALATLFASLFFAKRLWLRIISFLKEIFKISEKK